MFQKFRDEIFRNFHNIEVFRATYISLLLLVSGVELRG